MKERDVKMKKRIISLLLAVVMLLSVAGCGTAKKEAAMTYNQAVITEDMYNYWLSYYKMYLVSMFGVAGNDEAWSTEISSGVTFEDYCRDFAHMYIERTLIGLQLFNDYGLTLAQEVIDLVDADIEEKINSFGTKQALDTELAAVGIDTDTLREIYLIEEKAAAAYEHQYGEGGLFAASDAVVDQYYKDNYSRVKYIVLYTTRSIDYDENNKIIYDENGNVKTTTLTEAEKAAKIKEAEEAYTKAMAGESFEDLIKEYSDAPLDTYVNGFFVSSNEYSIYGETLVTAAADMKVGEIRKLEGSNGTIHIMKKYDLIERSEFAEPDKFQMENLANYANQQLYVQRYNTLAANIVYNEAVTSKYTMQTVGALPGTNY